MNDIRENIKENTIENTKENTKENKKGKRNGLITTITVHVCLLFLCIFLGFTFVTPPKGDVSIGFEALGVQDAGKSNELASSEQLANDPEPVEQTPQQSQSNPTEENTDTQEDSPVEVNRISDPSKQSNFETTKQIETNQTKETPPEKPKEVDPRLKAFQSALQGPDNPGGKGEGVQEGNQGSEKGVPNEDGNGGTGKDGMFDFGGRKALKPGNLKHDCQVRATADVRVTVDREGRVVNAVMVGGTNFNDCIEKKAISAAKSTKYTANPNGPQFQEGTISLSFHVN